MEAIFPSRKWLIGAAQLFISTLLAANLCAQAPVDLSSWQAYTYDTLGNQDTGTWVLSGDNYVVTQTAQCDPSHLLNGKNDNTYVFQVDFKPLSIAADDWAGLVFGYQDRSHFYLFEWNRHGDSSIYGIADTGMIIKKINAPTEDHLTANDLWESSSTTYSTLLASNLGPDKGYVPGVQYQFSLNFVEGNFTLIIIQGATELWNVVINDGFYTGGEFGLWSFSAGMVEFSVHICGDANSDETVNVSDAVWIINYIFAGGDPPDPLEAGDVNCDGTCNITDAVWIINYVFNSGYAPCDTDGDGIPDC